MGGRGFRVEELKIRTFVFRFLGLASSTYTIHILLPVAFHFITGINIHVNNWEKLWSKSVWNDKKHLNGTKINRTSWKLSWVLQTWRKVIGESPDTRTGSLLCLNDQTNIACFMIIRGVYHPSNLSIISPKISISISNKYTNDWKIGWYTPLKIIKQAILVWSFRQNTFPGCYPVFPAISSGDEVIVSSLIRQCKQVMQLIKAWGQAHYSFKRTSRRSATIGC